MGRATAKQKTRGSAAPRRGAATAQRKDSRQTGRQRGGKVRLTAAERKAALRARSGVQYRSAEAAAVLSAFPIGKARKSLKGISIYMHPLAKDALDRIARDQKRSVQDLGLEALNLLFRHYGERPIA